jgi:hypothetical protein
MAITHGTEARTALAEALNDFVNTGSGTAVVRVYDANATLLVEIELNNPAYNIVGEQAVLDGASSGIAVATGDAATFDLLNRDGDTVYSGTVGTSDADLEIAAPVTIVIGETVTITSHSWVLN